MRKALGQACTHACAGKRIKVRKTRYGAAQTQPLHDESQHVRWLLKNFCSSEVVGAFRRQGQRGQSFVRARVNDAAAGLSQP
jgi:hypothetical protein